MRTAQRFQSIAKLLYTQNPFYLISCGLIFYGIHLAVPQSSSLESRSLILIGSMAAYTLLMSVTAVCVIRFGNVWDDARSILLILLIGMLGMSASFDELCVSRWKLAAITASACFAFSAAIVEGVLFLTRIRFSWYRLPLYALLAVFFAGPVVAGYAVAKEHTVLTRWAAPLFSTAIAIALMCMAPALRKGGAYLAKNGTPWSWPMFPLAPFAVLLVLAVIRSHGVWMSFGSTTGSISFEPFLLAPMLLAIAFLIVESDVADKKHDLSIGAMFWLPALLAPTLWLGGSWGGMTALPIHAELTSLFGSTFTLGLLALMAFYTYAWLKQRPGAGYYLALTFVVSALISIPGLNLLPGFDPFMLAAVAVAILLVKSLRRPDWELSWVALVMVLAIACKLFADQWRLPMVSYATAGVICFTGAVIIGACFSTPLASFLRTMVAVASCVVALGLLFMQFRNGESFWFAAALLATAIVPAIYLFAVRRRWWALVAGINSLCTIVAVLVVAQHRWQPALFDARRWVIPIGLVCFVVASGISFFKTGAHRRFMALLQRCNALGDFEGGL